MFVLPALYGRAKFLRFMFTGQLMTIFGRLSLSINLLVPLVTLSFFCSGGQALTIQHYQ